ncbi:MAG: hypothetical protein OER88_09635 [Planctomycetota bacterium]|nr:hypothetical protein [Planctomycetota bacterium]
MLALVLLVPACRIDRPIHPYQLEGFPGAPIEPGLFEPRPGMRWTFRDGEKELVLEVSDRNGAMILTGSKEGPPVEVRESGEFVEMVVEDRVVDRPFKRAGQVGDSWELGEARYTVFGYDEIEVMGVPTRALVVAVDRKSQRDLYWFAPGAGWVRIRTERKGAVVRDARLVLFEAGPTR